MRFVYYMQAIAVYIRATAACEYYQQLILIILNFNDLTFDLHEFLFLFFFLFVQMSPGFSLPPPRQPYLLLVFTQKECSKFLNVTRNAQS